MSRANLYKNHVDIFQTSYTHLRTLTGTVVQESKEYADKMNLTQKLTTADIGHIRWDAEKKGLATENKLLENSSKYALASKDEIMKLLKRNEKSR